MFNYYQKGDLIAPGTVLFILEAMKMELSVVAPYFKGDSPYSNKKGYIRVTDACKKVSLNSYVECGDLIFIFSEDKEEDTQKLSFYNDKNDDDNMSSSLQEETIITNTGNLSLSSQPLEGTLTHHLEDSLSEQMSNLEKTAQTSSSENTPPPFAIRKNNIEDIRDTTGCLTL